jgi:hypothetical protein
MFGMSNNPGRFGTVWYHLEMVPKRPALFDTFEGSYRRSSNSGERSMAMFKPRDDIGHNGPVNCLYYKFHPPCGTSKQRKNIWRVANILFY